MEDNVDAVVEDGGEGAAGGVGCRLHRSPPEGSTPLGSILDGPVIYKHVIPSGSEAPTYAISLGWKEYFK